MADYSFDNASLGYPERGSGGLQYDNTSWPQGGTPPARLGASFGGVGTDPYLSSGGGMGYGSPTGGGFGMQPSGGGNSHGTGVGGGGYAQPPYQRVGLGSPEHTLYDRYSSMLTNPEGMTSDPAYKFLFNQGMQAFNRTAAARGMSFSGNTMAGAQDYGQGLAAKYFKTMIPEYGHGAEAELRRFMGPAQLQPGYAKQNNDVTNMQGSNAAARDLAPAYKDMINRGGGGAGGFGGQSDQYWNSLTPSFQRPGASQGSGPAPSYAPRLAESMGGGSGGVTYSPGYSPTAGGSQETYQPDFSGGYYGNAPSSPGTGPGTFTPTGSTPDIGDYQPDYSSGYYGGGGWSPAPVNWTPNGGFSGNTNNFWNIPQGDVGDGG